MNIQQAIYYQYFQSRKCCNFYNILTLNYTTIRNVISLAYLLLLFFILNSDLCLGFIKSLTSTVACPTLPDVTVSTASIDLSTNGQTTVATYSCPDGYVTDGESTLTCGSDGSWSSSPSDCGKPLLQNTRQRKTVIVFILILKFTCAA